jgi:hypothetical protein
MLFFLHIGGNASLTRGLNGSSDEVRIWSGVRDQATLVANATAKYVGNEAGLLAYYSFAEGNKQFVYDTTTSDDNTPPQRQNVSASSNFAFSGISGKTPNVKQKDQVKSDGTRADAVLVIRVNFNTSTELSPYISRLPLARGGTVLNRIRIFDDYENAIAVIL